MTPENKALMERYPQYYRDVSHLEVIDVYRVIDLFKVTDPTAQHALKKLLLSGERTGGKSIEVDLKEARDTLTRGLAMRAEDAERHQLGFDFATPGSLKHLQGDWQPQPVPPEPTPAAREYVMPLVTPGPATGEHLATLNSPAPQQAIRYCAHEGCEMRVRSSQEVHCMIHSGPAPQPFHGRYCAIGSCGRSSVKDGLCETHYQEVSKLEAETRPQSSPAASVMRHTR